MKKRVWLHCFEALMSDKSFLSRALKKDQKTGNQIPLLFKIIKNIIILSQLLCYSVHIYLHIDINIKIIKYVH